MFSVSLRLLLAATLLFTLVGAGFSDALFEERGDREEVLQRAELYRARIVRDAYGVPHIFGDRDIDAAFGFAYAQAQDNIRNIEQSFRFARGKMGEEKGREGAKTDYLIAAMRVRETFDEKYETDLSPKVRSILDAYADGINYYCAEAPRRCRKGFAPLTGREIASAPKTRAPFVYGLDDMLKNLFKKSETGPDTASIELSGDEYSAYLGVDASIVGSNAIAVSSSRSSDGHTRLFSNAHQPFVGPTALYEARIKSNEGWDIYGAFVSGSPFAIFGANSNLAWTITVSRPDLIDVYEMTVDDPADPRKYKIDGEWKDLHVTSKKLRVKVWGPLKTTVERKVYRSEHGPVLETPNGWFAISFAGYGDIQSMEQLYGMNTADTKEQWLEAMEKQGVAAFNVIYADKVGNIAYYYNARAPIRSPEWDWSTVAPGDRGDLLWRGIHPFRSVMPFVENPESGYVVSANHDPFHVTGVEDAANPDDFPAHLGVISETSNRGLRIHRLFDQDTSISKEELIRYKMDGYYASDSYLMQLLRELLSDPLITESNEFKNAAELLASWDGNTEMESRQTALATRIGHLLLGIQLNPTKSEAIMKDRPAALRRAIAELNAGFGRIDPKWGEVNRLRRGELDLPLRGGPDVLRAVYSTDSPEEGALSAIAGDSLQFLIEWDEEGSMNLESVYHYGANKIDETSPHYADQAELFAEEGFRTPPMTMEAAIQEATANYVVGLR
ncbi:MAG: penicillin acylase family protein [Pseudomonadota bacterium]